MDAAVYSPTHITTISFYMAGSPWATFSNNPAMPTSQAWPAANQAIYIPFMLPWPYYVGRCFWVNGSTASSAVSVAIYSADLEYQIMTTGAVSQSGASAVQYAAPTTPKLLPAGFYQLGVSCSGTTSRMFGSVSGTAHTNRLMGLTKEASAHPCPATPTPVAVTAAFYPLAGITKTTTGF